MTSRENLGFGYKRDAALHMQFRPQPVVPAPWAFQNCNAVKGSKGNEKRQGQRDRGCNFLVCIEPEHFLFLLHMKNHGSFNKDFLKGKRYKTESFALCRGGSPGRLQFVEGAIMQVQFCLWIQGLFIRSLKPRDEGDRKSVHLEKKSFNSEKEKHKFPLF